VSVTDQAATDESPVVQQVLAKVEGTIAPERIEAVREFARRYTRRLSSEDLAGVGADELLGQVLGAFQLADARGSQEVAVRAFNPTLGQDGYQTLGSVVETNTEDSPFLFDSVNEELRTRGLSVRRVIHPVMGVKRDTAGHIERIAHVRESPSPESVMHWEVDHRLERGELVELEDAVRGVLAAGSMDAFDVKRPTIRSSPTIRPSGEPLLPPM
jgi:glutamate dehydrogenase